MLQHHYLYEDEGILSIGREGEKHFGKRNFMQLFSVFDSPPLFTVFYGRTELGSVHQLTFQVKRDEWITLSLGGHSWLVKHVDWKRRQVFVEPGKERGKSRWFSAGQPLTYELCQATLRVLAGSVPDVSFIEAGSFQTRSRTNRVRMGRYGEYVDCIRREGNVLVDVRRRCTEQRYCVEAARAGWQRSV